MQSVEERPSRGREPLRSRRRPPRHARPRPRDRGGSLRIVPKRLGEVELGVDVGPKRPRQRERALEQHGSGALVASAERAPPRRQQPIPGAKGERGVGSAQLGLVAGGLLEVVADDLVQLDEGPPCSRASRRSGGAGRREPPSGARRRRRRGSAGGGSGSRPRRESGDVRGGSARAGRVRRAVAVTCGSSGASACTAPRWKISPSTAPRSSTRALGSSSWSSRAASSALSVGGTSTSPSSAAIASISVMKSGFPPALSAIRRRSSSGSASPISASASSGASGSSRSGTGQDGRRSSSSGRAMHRSSSGAPVESSRRRLDEIEERLLAPLEVVEADHERRLLLEQLAERPGDLVRARRTVALAQQRPDRGRRLRVGGQRVELLHDLDDRPVGDPLAVGKAAAADDAGLDRRRAPPRPAATCPRPRRRPPSRARSATASAPASHACRSDLPAPARDRRTAMRASAPAAPGTASEPERRHRLRLPLQRQRLDRLDHDRLAHERQRRLADQHLARLGRLLEPRRDVDGVPGRQPLLRPRRRPRPC